MRIHIHVGMSIWWWVTVKLQQQQISATQKQSSWFIDVIYFVLYSSYQTHSGRAMFRIGWACGMGENYHSSSSNDQCWSKEGETKWVKTRPTKAGSIWHLAEEVPRSNHGHMLEMLYTKLENVQLGEKDSNKSHGLSLVFSEDPSRRTQDDTAIKYPRTAIQTGSMINACTIGTQYSGVKKSMYHNCVCTK